VFPTDFQKLCARTEASAERSLSKMLIAGEMLTPPDQMVPIRLFHAMLGIQTEAGEAADVIKRWIFYGTPLDTLKLKDYLGNLLWYAALACNAKGFDMGEIMEENIRKHRVLSPEKFENSTENLEA
jgi:NTP pyrophosphatase (non-canonical NTP hydrolase)